MKDLEKMLISLREEEGATLKKYALISYKSGWQVATEGIETKDVKVALKAIQDYEGTCGIWLSKGVYYIDKSKRVKTKREALKIGREHNQISILNWRTMGLTYC